jgi:peptide/nickel transport system permease protein
MLNVFRVDYIRTARAKGRRKHLVLLRHALRNALLPVITLMGIIVSGLLSGAAVTESVFAWPGMGRLVLQAALNRDFPIIEVGVMFMAAVFSAVTLVVDLTYRFIDPRIRYD